MRQLYVLISLAFSAGSTAFAVEPDCLELLTGKYLSYEQTTTDAGEPRVTFAEFENFLRHAGLSDSPLVRAAVNQAILSHGRQRRDSGASYLEQHVFPVAVSVARALRELNVKTIDPQKVIAAALLHDSLEDDARLTDAFFVGRFGREVYELVKPLTKPKNADPALKPQMIRGYISGIASASLEVRLIKLADRLNNIISTRALRTVNDKVLAYIAETEQFYLPIAQTTSDYYYARLSFHLSELKLFVGKNAE